MWALAHLEHPQSGYIFASNKEVQFIKSDSGITIGKSEESVNTIPVRISRDPRMYLKRPRQFSKDRNKAKNAKYDENLQEQSEKKSFRCCKCEMWFSRKGTLRTHVNAVHMKLMTKRKRILSKFQCVRCGKLVLQHETPEEQLKSKSFMCEHCEKRRI